MATSMGLDPSVIDGHASTVTVLVTGGPGTGKTCFLRAASHGHAVLAGQPGSVWEAGSATLPTGVTVALRTTPGQRRWWWMWDQLATGVFGAVVLVDSTRLAASFPALDYLDARRLPHLVAINRPLGGSRNRREIREALRVTAQVPVLTCDATEPASVLAVLHHLTTAVPATHDPSSTPLPY
ncbi:ATP/GTP-binding protein [Micromonospora sp. AMSO12t]|uniref:ATP/GTP-binding protein n=1 Tax=unclassified Micromonospora TaxID=2617518 RepID=UPI001CED57D4|nr:ATP/GTP-binding protein [Micromonospora sp. AMSO12t]